MLRKLYYHQRKILYELLQKRSGGILFLEMRLGKSLIVLRYVKTLNAYPVLIVSPSSALFSWEDELQQEGISYINLGKGQAGKEKRKALLEIENHYSNTEYKPAVVLVNKEAWQNIGVLLKRIPWCTVVLDESHFLKNPKAKVSKYFLDSSWKRVPHRFCLSGTPAETSLDLFNQIIFVRLNWLGCVSYWQFRQKHFVQAWDGYSYVLKRDSRKLLHYKLHSSAIVLRRKDVNLDQKKIKEQRTVELPPQIRERYNQVLKEWELKTLTGEVIQYRYIIQVFTALRQLSQGIMPCDSGVVWSGKADLLLELLQDCWRGEQVVVWFSFVKSLYYVNNRLQKEGIKCCALCGDSSSQQREMAIKAFQNGELSVLLLQEQIGQTGLNLSCSSTAVYYSEPLSLSIKQQTEDRILSVQKKEPLLYVSLLTEDTIDLDIHKLLKDKHITSDLLLSKELESRIRKYRHG